MTSADTPNWDALGIEDGKDGHHENRPKTQDQNPTNPEHANYKGFVAGVFSGVAKLTGMAIDHKF